MIWSLRLGAPASPDNVITSDSNALDKIIDFMDEYLGDEDEDVEEEDSG